MKTARLRLEDAWKRYEKGEFIEQNIDEFLDDLKKLNFEGKF